MSDPTAALTAREEEVLALVAEGMSNKEIAQRLGITVGGVKFHITRLRKKTGCQSRPQLAIHGMRRGGEGSD